MLTIDFIECRNFKDRIRKTKEAEEKGYKVERPDNKNIMVIKSSRMDEGYGVYRKGY